MEIKLKRGRKWEVIDRFIDAMVIAAFTCRGCLCIGRHSLFILKFIVQTLINCGIGRWILCWNACWLNASSCDRWMVLLCFKVPFYWWVFIIFSRYIFMILKSLFSADGERPTTERLRNPPLPPPPHSPLPFALFAHHKWRHVCSKGQQFQCT